MNMTVASRKIRLMYLWSNVPAHQTSVRMLESWNIVAHINIEMDGMGSFVVVKVLNKTSLRCSERGTMMRDTQPSRIDRKRFFACAQRDTTPEGWWRFPCLQTREPKAF